MPVGSWYTAEDIGTVWQDAPSNPDLLDLLVESALVQILKYAPALAEGEPVPANYRAAQVMHTRNLWNTWEANPAGELGGEDFPFPPKRPVDWHVMNLLKPRERVPVVGGPVP